MKTTNGASAGSLEENGSAATSPIESQRTRCRVVHLTTVHPAFDVRIFSKECKSLARAGYDVTVLGCFDQNAIQGGVKVRGLGRARGRVSRILGSQRKIYREALRENASIYHFHDPELIFVGLLLKLKGKRVIYDAHEDVLTDIVAKRYLPTPIRRPLAWTVSKLEEMCSRRFSAVITATGPIARRFQRVNRRTVVVHNYPELDWLALKIDQPWTTRKMSVAYVGAIAVDRGAREMVKAMFLLPGDAAETLELAGLFSPATLEAELANLRGFEKVRNRGLLSRSDVIALLCEVRAGLVIFSPTSGLKDAVPIKMFEYMGAAIPFVASDFPGFRAIAEKHACGMVVDPTDPQKIAEAIDYLLSHPAEAEQMGMRGRRAVEQHYNWSTEEKKLLGLYEQVAAT